MSSLVDMVADQLLGSTVRIVRALAVVYYIKGKGENRPKNTGLDGFSCSLLENSTSTGISIATTGVLFMKADRTVTGLRNQS